MKSLYPGYFRPSGDAFKEMWKANLFAFDTNVLLNLYRYSDETREQLINLIESLKERIWIPKKVGDEFFDNRLDVLIKQIQEYESMTSKLDKVEAELSDARRHPFLRDETLEKLKGIFDVARSELRDNKENLLSRINDDEILQTISELFNGKIGIGFTEANLQDIYKDGEMRFQKKVPPGYVDGKAKASSGDSYRIYGDLVLWKEMIEKAKTENIGIIFISDDRKDDWWLQAQGRVISPQPNLIKEFQIETNNFFYMYTVEKFMEEANKFLEVTVSSTVIEEVRDVREAEIQFSIPKSPAPAWLGMLSSQPNLPAWARVVAENSYAIITEAELVSKLREYENLIRNDTDAYVGLGHFVTTILGEQGYEINHSYAILNDLIRDGKILIYERDTDEGKKKAIILNPDKTG